MAKVNKNRKYLKPVDRGTIVNSMGVFGLNCGQDLQVLQWAEVVRILLEYSCSA